VNFGDEMAQHRLGNFKVRLSAVLKWTDGDNVCGRATKHPLRFVAHRKHSVGAGWTATTDSSPQDDSLILT
jgi:hypothetical protein